MENTSDKLAARNTGKACKKRPIIELFIIFLTYTVFVLVLLSELFWYLPEMASLGAYYLIFVAPLVMGIIEYRLRKTMTISKYHQLAYILGLTYLIVYVIILVLFLVTLYFMGDKTK